MSGFDYDGVRMIIAEHNIELRQIIRTFLSRHGLHKVVSTASVAVLRDAIKDDTVDLVVSSDDLSEGEVLELIHDLRHHRIGNNPFIVVIVLTGDATPDNVRRIIGSGADALLVKPISMGQLLQRIELLTRARKKFVVTTDYVGPDRRDNPRPGTQEIPLIDVPNPVLARVEGGLEMADLQFDIERVAAIVNEQKMQRHAFQVGYLVDRLVPRYRDGGADERVIPLIERLVHVSEDISRRMVSTRFAHAGELCGSMVDLAVRIGKNPLSPDSKDIELMPTLAMAIRRAFEAEEEADVARDISETLKSKTEGGADTDQAGL